MSDEDDMTALHLTTIAFRMQCRVDVCLERNGGDEQAATTSSGIGISYGFAHEIARTCERAAEQFGDANTELTALRADIATYVQVSADQQGEIERLMAERDEALRIADKYRLQCQGVEEDFHALEENNERLRGALAMCVAALALVRKIPRPWIDGGITHAEWEGAWVKIDAARDAAKAALEGKDA